MRGAVLHQLDLRLVKKRVMRFSYGFVGEPLFVANEHPQNRRFRDKIDGSYRCSGVMKWCASIVISRLCCVDDQGEKVEHERVVRHSFVAHYSKKKYNRGGSLPLTCSVLVCQSPEAPKYTENTGIHLFVERTYRK